MQVRTLNDQQNKEFMYADFSSEVQAGAELLDTIAPGWAERVDVPTLNLADGTQCMLGQTWINRDLLPKVVVDHGEAVQLTYTSFADPSQVNGYSVLIGTLGEHLTKVAPEIREKYGDIDWGEAYGFYVSGQMIMDVMNHVCTAPTVLKCNSGNCGCGECHDVNCPGADGDIWENWLYEQLSIQWILEVEKRRNKDFVPDQEYRAKAEIVPLKILVSL